MAILGIPIPQWKSYYYGFTPTKYMWKSSFFFFFYPPFFLFLLLSLFIYSAAAAQLSVFSKNFQTWGLRSSVRKPVLLYWKKCQDVIETRRPVTDVKSLVHKFRNREASQYSTVIESWVHQYFANLWFLKKSSNYFCRHCQRALYMCCIIISLTGNDIRMNLGVVLHSLTVVQF